jgi:hypothetical protein
VLERTPVVKRLSRHGKIEPHCERNRGVLAAISIVVFVVSFLPVLSARAEIGQGIPATLEFLAGLEDRSTGTPGEAAAAKWVEKRFTELGLENIGRHRFSLPVLHEEKTTLTIPSEGHTVDIQPFRYNAITPQTIPDPGIAGPLVYVEQGKIGDFNGKPIRDSIILMDMDSGKNWLQAASLGAKALILVDRRTTPNMVFRDKEELSPIDFPIFYMAENRAREVFGDYENAPGGIVESLVQLVSDQQWKLVTSQNVYAVVPGVDPKLSEQILIVEAFYDGSAYVAGAAPAAEEGLSLAALLELAAYLKDNPPKRSVLLVATGGHAQALAGMREMIWSLRTRSREMRQWKKELEEANDRAEAFIEVLENIDLDKPVPLDKDKLFRRALEDRIKTEVDQAAQELMRLRLAQKENEFQDEIKTTADRRLLLRRLNWRNNLADLSDEEIKALKQVTPMALADHQTLADDTRRQLKLLRSAMKLRALARAEAVAVVSLHLSSHGTGVGAFNEGWLYKLKPEINRTASYARLSEVLSESAAAVQNELGLGNLYVETLRPNRLKAWQSYFLDTPPMGGEISALAGFFGFSLVTVNDARQYWGTPHDLPETVDLENAKKQTALICGLIRRLAAEPELTDDQPPRNGFSNVLGRANFIRHGELFPDQPAPGTMLLAFQGPAAYRVMVDTMGLFHLRGMADRKHVYDKVILEGYRFDPKTGKVVWAIDKPQTGKDAYRVKMQRRSMETDLIIFGARQMTVFNLLEPRSFRYMTKINLLDARLEAEPLRYWYSRIDTRSSIIDSIYLEPGTRMKMTLSDSVLNKKLILLNADKENPTGTGYMVDEWPAIYNTSLRVASDMWSLLGPRVSNLEKHGIYNEKIRNLQNQGLASLDRARAALKNLKYDRMREESARSWALATRVYNHVEETQRDVLFGVLFYIALFVPFAFCMERLLFSFTDIHKRIVAFLVILLALIAIIYRVHPAFQLAYSPTVVILAFFIMGLSLIVTLIIFFRFEEEMVLLQKRASHMAQSEISRWQAFVASFLLGVSNLKRRRIRTILTCATLVILTFTIMSFTSVKSLRHHARVMFKDTTPYSGFMMKKPNWFSVPSEALGALINTFEEKGVVAPRVWYDSGDFFRAARVPISRGDKMFDAEGLIGLSSSETEVTGFQDVLISGRWFEPDERRAVLIPLRMAEHLGVDPRDPKGTVELWGMEFEVIGVFSGQKMDERVDLDGEPITPVVFPGESALFYTETELEAMQSGEDIVAFQSRYQHVPGDLTVIIPYQTLLPLGGQLKGIAVRALPGQSIPEIANDLVDRFMLTIFAGEPDGTFMYHASDTLSYSGVPNILVPILISIFIVLNTMIGSVYERKREIGIYTSVGLAPSHVSFLFIAEAMAFAVLSVVLGYILAQGTASVFGKTALWSGITVNYSSLAGVAAMVLIFLVVLVSVIYPSRVASQIAIPDVSRSWTLPKAEGARLTVVLPVLMKYGELKGVGGYIYRYFQGHQDVSHGMFSTGDFRVIYECPTYEYGGEAKEFCRDCDCIKDRCLQLRSTVWLAPFDFGIMQSVDIVFCPSEDDPNFVEIRMDLVREAGEANAWHRVNKAFVNQFRKQLLMWRSLTKEAHEHFAEALDEAIRGDDEVEAW